VSRDARQDDEESTEEVPDPVEEFADGGLAFLADPYPAEPPVS
jgi:hypothetical protein